MSEESETEIKRRPTFEEVQRRIRERNMPKERAALRWGKVTDRIIRSTCGRFQIEKRGDGESTRYFAFLRPDTVIGHRLLSPDQAKTICEQHASPLPLEPTTPAAPPAPAPAPLTPGRDCSVCHAKASMEEGVCRECHHEREPGCDDDLEEEG